jgi:hypothetical protein
MYKQIPIQVLVVVAFLVLYLITLWEFVRASLSKQMLSSRPAWQVTNKAETTHTKIFTCTVTEFHTSTELYFNYENV